MADPFRGFLELSNLIGQADLKRRVAERLAVVKSKGWLFPHTLIHADEGMGRYTVANAIAAEISGPARIVTVSTVDHILHLSGALSSIQPNGCLVLRDIDMIESSIVKSLAPVFETGQISISIGTGPGARTHFIPLQPFSMIATCSNPRTLPAAILSGFTLEVLDPYSRSELSAIAYSSAVALGFRLDAGAAACAANSAEGTPRSIKALLQRVRPYAGNSTLSEADFLSILGVLGVNRKATNTGSGLIDDLKSMSGIEFEQWTAALLEKHGYRVKPTRAVGDHGIDLEIERTGRRIVVQCKRWSDTVGEPVVREFYGSMLNARADAGIFVTTSLFSIQARQFVEQKPITLLDLKSLLDLFLYGGAVEATGS